MNYIIFYLTVFVSCSAFSALQEEAVLEKETHVDAFHQPVVTFTRKGPQKMCIATKVTQNPQQTGYRMIDYLLLWWGPTEYYSCRQINLEGQLTDPRYRYRTHFKQNICPEEQILGEVAKQKFCQMADEFEDIQKQG